MDTATRMSEMPSSEETARLRALVPLHTLPDEALAELLEKASFESVAKGKMLFKQGDTDHENVYLLEGTVSLLDKRTVVDTVKAGSNTARFPIAHQLPRVHSARAKTAVRIARIDSRILSELLARTRTIDYQVTDLDDASEEDWMSMLLQSRVLQQVPAANIQLVMINVEQVEVEEGEDLIRAGDPGDYYYMLTKGRAVVRRDSGDGNGPRELATLGPGDAFGEEALLSDSPRNSTVTMLQDGIVLRLSKEHFLELIHNPVLDRLDMKAAQAKVDRGAIWLDMRSSEQYEESHLPGAINFPFESLRYQASSLAPDRHYVLYSNTGGRAMAGAFLLTERGFDVSVVEGGIRGANGEPNRELPGPQSAAAFPAADDPAVQQRLHEAELRTRELEERLKLAQRDQESETGERQQQLEQVRETIDQARRKLLETEEQKREALAAQQQAYAEMERLTSSLEAVELERAGLLDRMSEIEGLDAQLQTRLAKAERELIGERERAESAASSLQELSDRLTEVVDKREQEREQNARERGELKEEVTALQLELEQAQVELDTLRRDLEARDALGAKDSEALQQVQHRLGDAETTNQALQAERDQLASQLAESAAELEQLRASAGQLDELQRQLSTQQEESGAAARELESRLAQLDAERDALQQQVEDARERAEKDLLLAEERAAKLDQTLHDMEAQHAESADALKAELEAARAGAEALQAEVRQLRGNNDALQSQLASGSHESSAAVEQAQARVAELEARLVDEGREAADRLSAQRAELDAANTELHELKARAEAEAATHRAADERLAELQATLDQAHADAAREAEARQSELEQLRTDNASLQTQLSAGSQEASAAVEQAQARVAELEAHLQAELEQLRNEHAALQAQQVADSQEAGAALDQAQARVAELEAHLQDERERLAQAQQQAADEAGALQAELEQLRSDHAALQAQQASEEQQAQATIEQALAQVALLEERLSGETQSATERLDAKQAELDAARAEVEATVAKAERDFAAADEQARVAVQVLEAELERLRADNRSLRTRLEQGAPEADEAVDQLRAEKLELAHKLEERDLALAAAREQQAELIEALNAASAEREMLQLAMSDREDGQARLIDLENQVAEALRTHENEILAHEHEQRQLRDALADESERRRVLQGEVERLTTTLAESGDAAGDEDLRAERDALLAELAVRESEVEQLRGVLEEYIDQIRAAQSDGEEVSEVVALRAELDIVREQAIRDVAQMREKLAAMETQQRRLQQADGREAISHEAMRQRIDALESSLSERQRELADAEASRHALEDSLEDANRQLDEMQRELEKARIEAEQAQFSRNEAESARDQLQDSLQQLQEVTQGRGSTDFRDHRLKPSRRPIGMDAVAAPKRWRFSVIAFGIALVALEAASLYLGKGELFTALLRMAGQ